MGFKEGEIDGVIVKRLRFFKDDRGWLTELYRNDDLDPSLHPVMSYISMTLPGIVRGPHEHVEQADYFVFISATFKLVLWDRREGSATLGNRVVYHFGDQDPALVIIPPGVVHAYKNVGDREGLVFNLPNRLFAGQGKKEPVDEIRYEHDPNTIYKVDE